MKNVDFKNSKTDKTAVENISKDSLKLLAEERLKDAEILFQAQRYQGAFYLCGYVVELALKAVICQTLNWAHFPNKEKAYQTFKTHNLDTLLHLSGLELKIKEKHFKEWSLVLNWNPEMRYRSIEKTTYEQTQRMLKSTQCLLIYLWTISFKN